MNTKQLLEEISEDCLAQLTKYKFNKELEISDKHRKGDNWCCFYVVFNDDYKPVFATGTTKYFANCIIFIKFL